jgi:hypothetical protein
MVLLLSLVVAVVVAVVVSCCRFGSWCDVPSMGETNLVPESLVLLPREFLLDSYLDASKIMPAS